MNKSFKKANTRALSKPVRLWKKYVTHPKLMIFFIVLLLLPVTSFSYGKYKDWDNAQMIQGIAKDFPQLVAEVENATGLDLEIKSNCMTTQEKFGNGVRTCELLVSKTGEGQTLQKGFDILKKSSDFPVYAKYESEEGVNAEYRNKKSCQFRTQGSIYISCIIGVRDANMQLALDLF